MVPLLLLSFADREMSAGIRRSQAYLDAARRMAWPIIASTATTLAAFCAIVILAGDHGGVYEILALDPYCNVNGITV